jgi:ribose 5-phosphate isomerase B
MKIAIGADHAGFQYKEILKDFLEKNGATVKDFGTYSDASCDYPDFAHPLAAAIDDAQFDFGILICGTSNGMLMAANKHQGVRGGLAWTPEIAQIIRMHNNANVLGIPARFVSIEVAKEIVYKFINTDFEGGRHQRRIEKIPC